MVKHNEVIIRWAVGMDDDHKDLTFSVWRNRHTEREEVLTTSGWVFFPVDEYRTIPLTAVFTVGGEENLETHDGKR